MNFKKLISTFCAVSCVLTLGTTAIQADNSENVCIYKETFSFADYVYTPVTLNYEHNNCGLLSSYSVGVSDLIGFVEDSECVNRMRSNSFTTFNFTGTIDTDGGNKLYGPITLYSNQICQARLYGPSDSSLDYILALYELDSSNSISSLVTYSDFGNANTDFQSVSAVNTTSDSKNYAIAVISNSGYSVSDNFDLRISIGAGFSDVYEPNDSARIATTATLTNISSSEYFTLGASLNSPYDTDWYDLIVPSDAEFDTLTFIPETDISGISMEMFAVQNGSLVKQSSNGYTFSVNTGHNYFRVSYADIDNEDFTEIAYSLQMYETPNVYIDSVTYEIFMNGEEVPTQNYSSNGLRLALRGGSTFSCKVTYSSNGKIYTLADDVVTVDIYNRAWNEGAISYHVNGSANSNNGVTNVTVTSPQAYGQHTGVSNMRYDSSCRLTITSREYGELLTAPIYITSRIMS